MPQLDVSTYIPQVFWLIIIFSGMFGIFIGIFLPKISNIFQKRFESTRQADHKIQNLSEATRQLQKEYEEKKETAIRDTQDHIDAVLASIRETHESRLQSLEKEIQQELSSIQNNHLQQYANFEENYRSVINEAVTQTLAKLGMKNGR
jgi:F-type H+-transporting ATPase subunit b